MNEEIITSYSDVFESVLVVLAELSIVPTNVESSARSIYFRDEKTKQDFVFTLDTIQEPPTQEELDEEWDPNSISTEETEVE